MCLKVIYLKAYSDPILCAYAKQIWKFAVVNTCLIEIRHKPGKGLPLADALSRSHISETSKEFAIEQCTSRNLSRIFANHLFITNNAVMKI